MALLHKIAADLGFVPYTLDEITREAQKGNKEVTVTALKRTFPVTKDGEIPGGYQPMAVIGEKHMDIGAPMIVDLNPVKYLPGQKNLRHMVIEGQQLIIENTLRKHVKALCNSGVNATYGGFLR